MINLMAAPHEQLILDSFGPNPLQAPVNRDRGFSLEPDGDFATINFEGKQWYITPTDHRTGIPYPILQHEHLSKRDSRRTNVHHARHPESLYDVPDSIWVSSLARAAERMALLQLVNATDHNQLDNGRPAYHNYFFGPLPLMTEAEIFKYTISAVAGIFPKYAIDMRSGEPKIVVPTPAQMTLMRQTKNPQVVHWKKIEARKSKAGYDYKDLQDPVIDKETYVESRLRDYIKQNEQNHNFSYVHFGYDYGIIRQFFVDYVLRQDINAPESRVDEFLEASEPNQKRILGKRILRQAIDAATLEAAPTYDQARRHGVVHPRQPRSARGIVWAFMNPPIRRDPDHLTTLLDTSYRQLRAAA